MFNSIGLIFNYREILLLKNKIEHRKKKGNIVTTQEHNLKIPKLEKNHDRCQ